MPDLSHNHEESYTLLKVPVLLGIQHSIVVTHNKLPFYEGLYKIVALDDDYFILTGKGAIGFQIDKDNNIKMTDFISEPNSVNPPVRIGRSDTIYCPNYSNAQLISYNKEENTLSCSTISGGDAMYYFPYKDTELMYPKLSNGSLILNKLSFE